MTDLLTVTDRLPESGETITSTSFSTHHGGKGANSAVAAFRLSHAKPKNADAPETVTDLPDVQIRVCMVGAVGDDEFGAPLVQTLKSNGVDVSGIQTIPGKSTGVGVVIVESDFGENRILFNPGANHVLQPADFLTLDSLAGGVRPDLVVSQLEMRRDTIEQIVQTASREGIEVLLNPAPAQYLLAPVYKMITHLVVNETEASMLSGRQMEEMADVTGLASVTDDFLNLGVKNVVVTLGARGAYYSSELGGGGYVEAEKKVNVVDTTGAG